MPEAGAAELWRRVGELAGARVLIVGDLMLDRFVHGEIERISPEAPVPVLRRGRETRTLGGAGNVAANVASLGGRAVLIALVGEDAEGEELKALCTEHGVDNAGVVLCPARQTSTKARFIAQGQQLLRVDAETVAPPSPADRDRLLDAFERALGEVEVVVLSDYGKGVLLDGMAGELIARARARGLSVLVDPKGADFRRYAGADYLTPNLKELREASGLSVDNDAEVTVAARGLIAQAGVAAVIVTRSREGMSVIDPASATHIPTQAQEVFDVMGAGDTVMAVLALCLARGFDLTQAAMIANGAAGIVVSKLGTAQVTPGELTRALQLSEGGQAETVVDRDAARALAEGWRAQGLTVGFTNGCFDILHPGHVSLLQQARSHCDRLVVGLNSDGSVRRLKGADRPVNGEAARAAVLAALKPVDLVVVFEEDTPEALIGALQPDVLVKGADYTIDQVVGADIVLARGGRVELATLVEGQSTTRLVERLGSQARPSPFSTEP